MKTLLALAAVLTLSACSALQHSERPETQVVPVGKYNLKQGDSLTYVRSRIGMYDDNIWCIYDKNVDTRYHLEDCIARIDALFDKK